MAKHKRSSKRPQPKHKKQKKSQHDKIRRLRTRNAARRKTCNAKVPLIGVMRTTVAVLQAVMDRRIAFRLAIIVAGMFLADGRHTASAWFVAAGVRDDWDRFYACLISVCILGDFCAAEPELILQENATLLMLLFFGKETAHKESHGWLSINDLQSVRNPSTRNRKSLSTTRSGGFGPAMRRAGRHAMPRCL